MAEQAKAGDVGHGFHPWDVRKGCASDVHLAHDVPRQPLVLRLQQRFFLGGGQNADPQRFGQEQFAPGFGGAVFLHSRGRHNAGDRQAKNRLRGVNGVAPGQRNPRLLAGKASALDHLPGDLWRQRGDRPAEDRNRHDRLAAHGKDIANGVGGGDAAKVEGIIHDRHKEIGRADDAGPVAEIVHRRVIPRLIAYQQVRIDKFRLLAVQNGLQHLWRNFASAACPVAVLC